MQKTNRNNEPMKVESLEPALRTHAVEPSVPAISRRAMYLGSGPEALFAWYHHAARSIPRDCVAVICAPMGPEYTRSHRTIRHLADRLATAGIAALRFDYQGSGDSPGSELDADRFGQWRRSVAAAAWHAKRLSGCTRVCLIGVRLGATLAALEAEEVGADLAVLWNPVVKGRAYARELQAIAMTAAEDSARSPDGAFESAGFRIEPELFAAIKSVDLTRARFKPGARVLLVGRDDLAADATMGAALSQAGTLHESITVPGWNGMMADHQFTVVPDEALDTLVGWIRGQSVARPAVPRPALPAGARTLAIAGMEERVLRFGADSHLFGVLARPDAGSSRPVVIMLNAGSIHHVGPHRLYVNLARELAGIGYPSLRLDHEGLGDSVPRAPDAVENEPYAASAMDDVQAAMDALRAEGHERFILLGLCSGAHTAFHAGRRFEGSGIERVILINPWYFYWSAGMTYDPNCHHYENVAMFQKSMRDSSRWKRLLSGEIDPRRLAGMARIALSQVRRKLQAYGAELREILIPSAGTPLSRDLKAILALDRKVSMYEADGEPAGAVLMTEARRTLARARRSGAMTLENVPGGDHTFSQSGPRDDLVRRIVDALRTAH
jgi:alpha-beta hydrolase superfamily lysophospholipase